MKNSDILDLVDRIKIGTSYGQKYFYYRKHGSDPRVIDQIFRSKDYNFQFLKRYKEILQLYRGLVESGRTPLIIDAGANIGCSSVYFSSCFPKAKVVAIEPDHKNYFFLKKNTLGFNIEAILAGVSSTQQKLRIVDSNEGSWAIQTAIATAQEEGIDSVTLDDLYLKGKDSGCDPFIVKIDIEGGEQDLFSANTGWLKDTPILIIELHDWMLPKGGSASNFIREISALDRDFVHFGENIFSISNAF